MWAGSVLGEQLMYFRSIFFTKALVLVQFGPGLLEIALRSPIDCLNYQANTIAFVIKYKYILNLFLLYDKYHWDMYTADKFLYWTE